MHRYIQTRTVKGKEVPKLDQQWYSCKLDQHLHLMFTELNLVFTSSHLMPQVLMLKPSSSPQPNLSKHKHLSVISQPQCHQHFESDNQLLEGVAVLCIIGCLAISYPRDASGTPSNNTLPNVPWGTKLPQVENLSVRESQINDLRSLPAYLTFWPICPGWQGILCLEAGKTVFYFFHAFIFYFQTSWPNLPEKSASLIRSTAIRRAMMLGPERLTPIVMTLWLVLLKPTLPLTDGREREAKDKSL